MDYWNYTTTPSTKWWYNYTFPTDFSIPTIPEYTVGPVPPTATQNPLLDNITFAVRVILFIICLMENGIAVFILHKNTRNGRRTFAQYMLISIACVDLTTLIYYSATTLCSFRMEDSFGCCPVSLEMPCASCSTSLSIFLARFWFSVWSL